MGIFKSLKGQVDVGTGAPNDDGHYASSTHNKLSAHDERCRLFGGPEQYSSWNYASQSSSAQDNAFSPPLGPPPSHGKQDSFEPPSGPPPSHRDEGSNPPPYHDWTVIPDNALLPPPPALPQDYSPSNNASYDSAARAHEWCAQNAPYTPSPPNPQIRKAVQLGEITIERSFTLARTAELRSTAATGIARCRTRRGQQDTILMGTLPLFFAAVDHPLLTERAKTIYYEVHVLAIQDSESGIAVGFAAKPYPPWRLPGWHRASLAVHGDDGRRFVNDSWGGSDFVQAFKVGDTVGIGMQYLPQDRGAGKCKTKVIFTRNGRLESGWDVDEERDAERDEGVEGLQGELDLYPTVGLFGAVECETRLKSDGLMYRPD